MGQTRKPAGSAWLLAPRLALTQESCKRSQAKSEPGSAEEVPARQMQMMFQKRVHAAIVIARCLAHQRFQLVLGNARREAASHEVAAILPMHQAHHTHQ